MSAAVGQAKVQSCTYVNLARVPMAGIIGIPPRCAGESRQVKPRFVRDESGEQTLFSIGKPILALAAGVQAAIASDSVRVVSADFVPGIGRASLRRRGAQIRSDYLLEEGPPLPRCGDHRRKMFHRFLPLRCLTRFVSV
jgi:hypothetical protein